MTFQFTIYIYMKGTNSRQQITNDFNIIDFYSHSYDGACVLDSTANRAWGNALMLF